MDLLQKSNIISEFTERYKGDQDFKDFFDYHDLGVPMAIAFINEYVNITTNGIDIINETYLEICDIYGADYEDEYENLDDLIG